MEDIKKSAEGSRAKLLNFVDVQVMKEILEAFTETTGLMANIVDIEGRSIFSRENFNNCCSFCRYIYSLDGGLERCRKAYKRYGKHAALFGEPYIFRCPSGLVEWAAPIIVEGEHLGSVICGQVLMWNPEDFFWLELRDLNRELTSDFTELFAQVKELPIVSPSVVKSASYLMHIIANYITKTGWTSHAQTKEINYQQTLLHKEIENRERLTNGLAGRTIGYSFDGERELMTRISLGETEIPRVLLQKLLAEIMGNSNKDIGYVRASVVELSVLMSRSAVDAGVSLKKTYEGNSEIFAKIYETNTMEGVCLQAQKLLEYYLADITGQSEQPNNGKVQEIKIIIRRDYKKNLTLESISNSVFLSPSYATRLFKKIQGCSIMEYLTKTRLDEAKRLLCNPLYLVEEIATNVGYTDASYFAKVFRRSEGVTPTQYRNMQSNWREADGHE